MGLLQLNLKVLLLGACDVDVEEIERTFLKFLRYYTFWKCTKKKRNSSQNISMIIHKFLFIGLRTDIYARGKGNSPIRLYTATDSTDCKLLSQIDQDIVEIQSVFAELYSLSLWLLGLSDHSPRCKKLSVLMI